MGKDEQIRELEKTVDRLRRELARHKQTEAADRAARRRLRQEVERKNRDLRAMNDTLETIYNASSESIWVCDGQGVVMSINPATEELLGIRSAEVIGRNIDDLVDEGHMDRSATREVLETGKQVSLLQTALKTGKQLLVTGTPVFGDDGAVSMVIVNERDMTQLNQLQDELQQAREEITKLNLAELEDQEIIAHSEEMQNVLLSCRKLADMNVSNILILGESGTGKGLMAKYLHSSTPGLTGPFVRVNCAALPENLLEAELFGYEKHAFTGAGDKGKIGLFEMAQDGTLFLDEIGELPLSLQAKLLHCLEEREIMHLGGLTPIPVNCHVTAATNQDLAGQVAARAFRQDLYFRLNTFPITLPPLRHRPEDILELTLFFLKKYNEQYKLNRWISSLELKRIQSYPFPGNVRELKNSIKKAVVMAEKNSLDAVVDPEALPVPPPARAEKVELHGEGFNQTIARIEKQLLTDALETCRTTRALALHLDMTQSQVVRKLKKYSLNHLLKRNQKPKRHSNGKV